MYVESPSAEYMAGIDAGMPSVAGLDGVPSADTGTDVVLQGTVYVCMQQRLDTVLLTPR